jgi:hypothetical protein
MLTKRPITKKYLKAWESLYSTKSRRGVGTDIKKGYTRPVGAVVKPQPHIPTEAEEQSRLVRDVRALGMPIFSIPNASKRTLWGGQKERALGLLTGMPDLMMPVARGGYHGLFIEMKRLIRSKLSLRQKECLAMLSAQGYRAVVARGYDEAIMIVNEYLKG